MIGFSFLSQYVQEWFEYGRLGNEFVDLKLMDFYSRTQYHQVLHHLALFQVPLCKFLCLFSKFQILLQILEVKDISLLFLLIQPFFLTLTAGL